MSMPDERPLVGISSCLLGNPVRYDGGHKLDRYLRDTLGRYVKFVPVCPEVECGLGIPREAMHLVDSGGRVRLMTRSSGRDLTGLMEKWLPGKLAELDDLPLCGFIFKSKSPSSGLYRIKIHRENGGFSAAGTGLFAGAVARTFPHLPVEEDGRLHDPRLRENFIERLFVMHRWHALNGEPKKQGRLMIFHATHKYLLMAHSPKLQGEMGRLLGTGGDLAPEVLYERYLDLLTRAMQCIATVAGNTNVLQHIMGYFKKQLSRDEKTELQETIDRYHAGMVPLVVPLTLINHYIRIYRPEYLVHQVYFNPHPLELMLRNHV